MLSQPIKGTAQRSANAAEDEELKRDLKQSQKERSENVMIVDLVRNDLSRICKDGSVQVDELFGIYPFPQVHQMISTISGELKDDYYFFANHGSHFSHGLHDRCAQTTGDAID